MLSDIAAQETLHTMPADQLRIRTMRPAAPNQQLPSEQRESPSGLGWLGWFLALAFLAVLAVGIPAALSQATQAASAESRPALQATSPAITAMAPAAVAPNGKPTTPLSERPSASAFEAQAKLFAKLRQFYGGSGALRGLVPILMLMVGPFKVIPGFLRLTARASEPMRRQIAWNGFLLSTATVLVLALFGYRLLVNFNIPLTAILASAGLVLVLVALRLVLAQYGDDDVYGDQSNGQGDGPETSRALPKPPENPGLDLVLQPLVFPIILTPYGVAVIITMSALVRELEGSPASLIAILLVIMVLNLLAMLYARQILTVIKPRVLQMLGLVLGIIQLSLGITLLFGAVEVQALAIKELLR
jgi:multiple antibiotic resistance protein